MVKKENKEKENKSICSLLRSQDECICIILKKYLLCPTTTTTAKCFQHSFQFFCLPHPNYLESEPSGNLLLCFAGTAHVPSDSSVFLVLILNSMPSARCSTDPVSLPSHKNLSESSRVVNNNIWSISAVCVIFVFAEQQLLQCSVEISSTFRITNLLKRLYLINTTTFKGSSSLE